jgi:hypothetical protein
MTFRARTTTAAISRLSAALEAASWALKPSTAAVPVMVAVRTIFEFEDGHRDQNRDRQRDRHALRQRPGPRHDLRPQDHQDRSAATPGQRPQVGPDQRLGRAAALDAVGGARITSAIYEASPQSALDKLAPKAANGTRGNSAVPDVQEHDSGPDGGPPGQFTGP